MSVPVDARALKSMGPGSTANPIRMMQLLAELRLSGTLTTPQVSTHPIATHDSICSRCMPVHCSGCTVVSAVPHWTGTVVRPRVASLQAVSPDSNERLGRYQMPGSSR
jgi:hypothetical protein